MSNNVTEKRNQTIAKQKEWNTTPLGILTVGVVMFANMCFVTKINPIDVIKSAAEHGSLVISMIVPPLLLICVGQTIYNAVKKKFQTKIKCEK